MKKDDKSWFDIRDIPEKRVMMQSLMTAKKADADAVKKEELERTRGKIPEVISDDDDVIIMD